MKYVNKKDGLDVYLKVKSTKRQEVINFQLKLAIKRIISQFIYPKFKDDEVLIQFGYVDNDFTKGLHTLKLTFKIDK